MQFIANTIASGNIFDDFLVKSTMTEKKLYQKSNCGKFSVIIDLHQKYIPIIDIIILWVIGEIL